MFNTVIILGVWIPFSYFVYLIVRDYSNDFKPKGNNLKPMEIDDVKVIDMNVEKFLIMDGRQSTPPSGTQKIIEEYSKKVMKRLYNKDLYVFFCSFKNTEFQGYNAFFRGKEYPPLNNSDKKIWEINKQSSITFNTDLHTKDNINPRDWGVILHEVTHFEIGMDVVKKNNKWHVDHDEKMDIIVKKNAKNVIDLAKEFLKEGKLDINDIK